MFSDLGKFAHNTMKSSISSSNNNIPVILCGLLGSDVSTALHHCKGRVQFNTFTPCLYWTRQLLKGVHWNIYIQPGSNWASWD